MDSGTGEKYKEAFRSEIDKMWWLVVAGERSVRYDVGLIGWENGGMTIVQRERLAKEHVWGKNTRN